jgi:hypothetical protein
MVLPTLVGDEDEVVRFLEEVEAEGGFDGASTLRVARHHFRAWSRGSSAGFT